jgi:hypothetical protein
MTDDTMWTCPSCGRRFTRKGQYHTCGDYSVEGFLEGASDKAIGLFDRFSREVERVGPYEYAPAKSRVGFQRRRIFATITGLGKDRIRGHLVLNARHESDKFTTVTRVCDTDIVHNFIIRDEDFFDDEFREFLRLAFEEWD